VKDVLAHLAAGERYDQACLDDSLGELHLWGGVDGQGARRRRTPPAAGAVALLPRSGPVARPPSRHRAMPRPACPPSFATAATDGPGPR